jgi:hypothetical protein
MSMTEMELLSSSLAKAAGDLAAGVSGASAFLRWRTSDMADSSIENGDGRDGRRKIVEGLRTGGCYSCAVVELLFSLGLVISL